jgi:hypothetical protein
MLVKLKDYNCVRINITGSVPYDNDCWKKIVAAIDRKKAIVAKRNASRVSVKSIFICSDKNADYHYHFAADKYTEKRSRTIEFKVGIHLNPSTFRQVMKKKASPVADLETWLLNILGQKFKKRSLDLDLDTTFIFKKPVFDSVLPVPFISPFENLAGKNILGEVSISGLKFKLEKSDIGLKTIYFETFRKFIAIRSSFKQKIILNTGVIENFINSAAKMAALFVKKQEQSNVRKKA